MDDIKLKELFIFYIGTSASDLLVKLTFLNYIYFKAKKEAPKLEYKGDLTNESIKTLINIRLVHLYILFSILHSSFVPGYGQYTTKNILDRKEIFYSKYKRLFEVNYNEINEMEEKDREACANFLKDLHDTDKFRDAMGDEYKGHKFDDETIRIKRSDMIKFLKSKRIILEVISEDDEYTDYYVKLLDK